MGGKQLHIKRGIQGGVWVGLSASLEFKDRVVCSGVTGILGVFRNSVPLGTFANFSSKQRLIP